MLRVVKGSSVYLFATKDGVVDHDAIDLLLLVGLGDLLLEVLLVDLAQLKSNASLGARLGRPLGILLRGRVLVREETDQLGLDLTLLDVLLDLITVVPFLRYEPPSLYPFPYRKEADTVEARTVFAGMLRKRVDMRFSGRIRGKVKKKKRS